MDNSEWIFGTHKPNISLNERDATYYFAWYFLLLLISHFFSVNCEYNDEDEDNNLNILRDKIIRIYLRNWDKYISM